MNKSDRLTLQQWNEIDNILTKGYFTPTEVVKQYGISRNSLYAYAKRNNKTNWFKKDKKHLEITIKPRTFFQKMKDWFIE